MVNSNSKKSKTLIETSFSSTGDVILYANPIKIM